jgi:hypothetical protein
MLNRQLKWVLILIAIGLVVTIVSYATRFSNSCSLQQLSIVGEIKQYDQTKDPQFCDKLNTKILHFNEECKSDAEELDCG